MSQLDQFTQKVHQAIGEALGGVSVTDLLLRIAWCQEHGDMQFYFRLPKDHDDDVVEVWWGGRPLLISNGRAFLEDGPLPEGQWVRAVPDDPSELNE